MILIKTVMIIVNYRFGFGWASEGSITISLDVSRDLRSTLGFQSVTSFQICKEDGKTDDGVESRVSPTPVNVKVEVEENPFRLFRSVSVFLPRPFVGRFTLRGPTHGSINFRLTEIFVSFKSELVAIWSTVNVSIKLPFFFLIQICKDQVLFFGWRDLVSVENRMSEFNKNDLVLIIVRFLLYVDLLFDLFCPFFTSF